MEAVSINTTCAVFAESEIVSLLATGVNKNSIIKGINNAVAKRIANLVENGHLEEEIYIEGGPGNPPKKRAPMGRAAIFTPHRRP